MSEFSGDRQGDYIFPPEKEALGVLAIEIEKV